MTSLALHPVMRVERLSVVEGEARLVTISQMASLIMVAQSGFRVVCAASVKMSAKLVLSTCPW